MEALPLWGGGRGGITKNRCWLRCFAAGATSAKAAAAVVVVVVSAAAVAFKGAVAAVIALALSLLSSLSSWPWLSGL